MLCVLAYAPSLRLPFISDDYIQIELAREYGAPGSWGKLAADPLYRCRATSLVATWATDRLFGAEPLPFRLSSLILHAANSSLVVVLLAQPLGGVAATAAGAFFAVHQGHQEAVIWYAALPELLLFFFGLLMLLGWRRWLDRGRRTDWLIAAGMFVLALLSKESAAVLPALLALTGAGQLGWKSLASRRLWIGLAPFFLVVPVYFVAAWLHRHEHLHFSDGTFSFGAPFWIVIPRSILRLLWIAGVAAIAVLAWRRRPWAPVGFALAWMALALGPYSFLTYMPHVPSRHTYLAAAGLALLAGSAFATLWEFVPRRLAIAAACAAILLNCGYVWTRKHRQYLDRAAPTERLVRLVQESPEPVSLACFPYSQAVAEATVLVRLGADLRRRLNTAADVSRDGSPFCFDPPRR
ncbi:MAG: glycosyltransferase family 39 protein [Bryobacterales bacterium]|nr:glycosyltransferase family 39 protein [Bryobacterales bacterium]